MKYFFSLVSVSSKTPTVAGISNFGVSSPAYPTRSEEQPGSNTRAPTSSINNNYVLNTYYKILIDDLVYVTRFI